MVYFDAMSTEVIVDVETELHRRVMGTRDPREGLDAFLARREPRFSARLSTDWKPLTSNDGVSGEADRGN